MQQIILIAALVIFSAALVMAGSPLAINAGGTNNIDFTYNKFVFYNGSSLTSTPYISTDGTSIVFYDSASSSIIPTISSRIQIWGAANSASGPHSATYVSSSNYPVRESLNHNHDNTGECYNCYYNGDWRCSSNTPAFRIYKYNGEYKIGYAACASAGSIIGSFTEAFRINGGVAYIPTLYATAGVATTLTATSLTASTINFSGGGILDFSGRETYAITTSGPFAATANIVASRINKVVTLSFKALTATSTASGPIYINVSTINNAFYPYSSFSSQRSQSWPVIVQNTLRGFGVIRWESGGAPPMGFRIFASIALENFGVGAGRGYPGDFSITYYAQ